MIYNTDEHTDIVSNYDISNLTVEVERNPVKLEYIVRLTAHIFPKVKYWIVESEVANDFVISDFLIDKNIIGYQFVLPFKVLTNLKYHEDMNNTIDYIGHSIPVPLKQYESEIIYQIMDILLTNKYI